MAGALSLSLSGPAAQNVMHSTTANVHACEYADGDTVDFYG